MLARNLSVRGYHEDLYRDLLLSELPCFANGGDVDIDRVPFDLSSGVGDCVLTGVNPGISDANLRAEWQNFRIGAHSSLIRFRSAGGFSSDGIRGRYKSLRACLSRGRFRGSKAGNEKDRAQKRGGSAADEHSL